LKRRIAVLRSCPESLLSHKARRRRRRAEKVGNTDLPINETPSVWLKAFAGKGLG